MRSTRHALFDPRPLQSMWPEPDDDPNIPYAWGLNGYVAPALGKVMVQDASGAQVALTASMVVAAQDKLLDQLLALMDLIRAKLEKKEEVPKLADLQSRIDDLCRKLDEEIDWDLEKFTADFAKDEAKYLGLYNKILALSKEYESLTGVKSATSAADSSSSESSASDNKSASTAASTAADRKPNAKHVKTGRLLLVSAALGLAVSIYAAMDKRSRI
jgi:hypothetical protein